MIPDIPQLMLAFEPASDSREGDALLRVFRNERDYFDARSDPADVETEAHRVRLPRAFQETALMDDPGGWRQRRRATAPARELGLRMWMQLPEAVQQVIGSGTAEEPLRVSILSSGTGLDVLPWEWLNGGPEQAISASSGVRFVRLVPVLYAPPPLTVALPLRVLVVITNPKDERLLQPDIELRTIQTGLLGNSDYEMRVLMEPRPQGLQQALEWSPHVLHYVGHAGISGSTGNIILHDDREGTAWLSANELAHLLPASVRLLCLSTCVTAANYQLGGLVRIAHTAAELALPTTIVNQYALGEATATAFWNELYPALVATGGNVVEAFHRARLAARQIDEEHWDWASFSLVIRDGFGHPLRFDQAAEGQAERFATEIQAQWSARLANNLALRMRSLGVEGQQSLRETLGAEAERLGAFAAELDKEKGS